MRNTGPRRGGLSKQGTDDIGSPSTSGASGVSREAAFAARIAAASSAPLLDFVASSLAAFLAFASSFSVSTSSANLLRHSSV